MSYALLFSGQGTQHAQMLPWLDDAPAARQVLALLDIAIGGPWREKLSDEACRSANAIAQPLIVGSALAAWAALLPLLAQPPEVVAGYSVGEVAALCAAACYAPLQAITLAQQRARLMDAAVAGHDTGMLAISAVEEGEVLASCPGLECAIRIDPDNNVFGGARTALLQAQETLRHRAQFKRICVALASHTSWMNSASAAFVPHVKAAAPGMPECPVALNSTGHTSRSAAVLADALATQIRQTVQWGACMAAIAERQPTCVLEIGGGQALARMWAARYPYIAVRSLDEFRGVEGAAAWLNRQL